MFTHAANIVEFIERKIVMNWVNIGKVGICIAAIVIYNGVIMGIYNPPLAINIIWSIISGAAVGYLAVMKWKIF